MKKGFIAGEPYLDEGGRWWIEYAYITESTTATDNVFILANTRPAVLAKLKRIKEQYEKGK